MNSILSASHALTASYVLNAVSASYSDTASYVLNAVSSSYSDTASTSVSASYASTASYVINAISSSHIEVSSGGQGQITIGDVTVTVNSLGVGDSPSFGALTLTSLTSNTFVSASGKLFASLSYDDTPITEGEGGIVVYDTASG